MATSVERVVQCSEFMTMKVFVREQQMTAQRRGVALECSRGSLDLSPSEALEIGRALIWAANGGIEGRQGT